MTVVLRPVVNTDLESIHQLALQSGVGLTTLSKDIHALERLITLSVESFNKTITSAHHEFYLFVLEDMSTREIVGTAGIKACLGNTTPSYTYKIVQRTRIAHDIGVRTDQSWLMLVNQFHESSELCTLYLRPDYRRSHHGLFLSRARFLYMANHPERFGKSLIAELRGVTDATGHSPFWNSLGYHFFNMGFEEADALTSTTNKQFIADLLPEHPIPVALLDKHAQAVIGVPNPEAKPAMEILLLEGFRYTQSVDIFDAGPVLEAPLSNIRSINQCSTKVIMKLDDNPHALPCILSTITAPFYATLGGLYDSEEGVVISEVLADQLHVGLGDAIRFLHL